MELILLLLSAIVGLCQQQLRQHPNQDKFWLAPYYSTQSAVISNYDDFHANDDNGEIETPFFRQLQRNEPDTEEDYVGIKLRNEDANRYHSSFVNRHTPQNNARLVIKFTPATNFLNKVKTITFTLTSSVTFTKVQSCIPSSQFSSGYSNVICRRKRGEFAESSITKLAISPFNVQSVEPTISSPLHPATGRTELPNGQADYPPIDSSKDEENLNDMRSPRTVSSLPPPRIKRLFFHFVTTTTVVSYSFFSATNTKTVNLVSVLSGQVGSLICRPQDYSVCSE